MGWFDGPMKGRGAPRNRTLLQWGIASKRHQNTLRDEPRMSRRARAQRSRDLATFAEGGSFRHDQMALGSGPFGRSKLWRWNNYWKTGYNRRQQKRYSLAPWSRDQ